MTVFNQTSRILGGNETQIYVGVGPHTIAGQNVRGFAFTVRTQGTIIAWVTGQDDAPELITAFVPTWVGIVLNQGDYIVSRRPIVQFQMTAATDSVAVHCDRPY